MQWRGEEGFSPSRCISFRRACRGRPCHVADLFDVASLASLLEGLNHSFDVASKGRTLILCSSPQITFDVLRR